jgi:hypothetical protein
VINLLADANIQGHVALLTSRMQSEAWRDFWDLLDVRSLTFAEVELNPADSDAVVWQRCQERALLLVTDNRNARSFDSLEATIRAYNTPQSLPVFTVGDATRVLSDREYAERVVHRLLAYLLELESLRGAGRLYLP